LQVGDAFQVQVHFALAHTEEVVVSVGHSGEYSRAMQISYARLRILELLHLAV
jgi:hypothetical protein